MEIRENICFVKVTFIGLYEWGQGWLSTELYNNYEKALETWKGIFFKVFKHNDEEYLVGVQGSAYLHPMDFNITLTSCGVKSGGSYFNSEISELKKFAEHICKTCGCEYKIQVSNDVSINVELEEK